MFEKSMQIEFDVMKLGRNKYRKELPDLDRSKPPKIYLRDPPLTQASYRNGVANNIFSLLSCIE